MTRRLSIFVVRGLMLIAVLCVFANSPARALEVLVNGGFEDSVGPTGWSLTQSVSSPAVGDYNGNGIVDAADYVSWRDNPAGFGGSPAGYDTWRANFGSSGSSSNQVSAVEHADLAAYPASAEGLLGLFIKPYAGNVGEYADQNRQVNVVLTQTYTGAVANRTYTFTGHSYFQTAASNNIDTLFADSPSGAVPSPTQTYFQMEFLNSSNTVLQTNRLDLPKNRLTDTLPADYLENSVSALAPAGTNKVRVTAAALNMVASCTAACPAGQDVFFDNFTLKDNVLTSLDRLNNGNLDTPGAPTNWTLQKTAQDNVQFATQDYARHSGAVGMWIRSWSGGDVSVLQTVPGTAGSQYSFSGWSKWESGYIGADPGSATQTFMKLEFLDGSNAVIGSPVNLDLRTVQVNDGNWHQLTMPNATAPAGTVSVRVSAGATGLGNSGIDPQSAMFDDFSLIKVGAGTGNLLSDFAVPEPATLSLLLNCVVASLSIRRRSN